MHPVRALGARSGMSAAWLWASGLLLPVLLSGAGPAGRSDPTPSSAHPGAPLAVRAALAELALLPCAVSLRAPAGAAPRIKWTRVQAGGARPDTALLVAQGPRLRVARAWQGRVSLPAYPRRAHNATLLLGPLRASDTGLYRCQAVSGLRDQQRLLSLEVTGVVFHYRAAQGRYALTFPQARAACRRASADLAAPRHLQAAFLDGLDNCDAGWLADRSVRYPITHSRPGCYGDRSSQPGVRSYGRRDPQERYDVYCFARELQGEVFYVGPAGRLTLAGARAQCALQGASLATAGQLHLAWREGLDQCDPGWLADGSVRYPIHTARRRCGGPTPGVRTLYRRPDRTGFPAPSRRFDAYCFRAHGDRQAPASGDESGLSAEGPAALESSGEEPRLPDMPATPSLGPQTFRRGRFRGLNGRHFQQQEETQTPTLGTLGETPPPAAAPASGSHNVDSWGELSNEVEGPGAGDWSPPEPWLWPSTAAPPSIAELNNGRQGLPSSLTPDLATMPPWPTGPPVTSPNLPPVAMLRAPRLWAPTPHCAQPPTTAPTPQAPHCTEGPSQPLSAEPRPGSYTGPRAHSVDSTATGEAQPTESGTTESPSPGPQVSEAGGTSTHFLSPEAAMGPPTESFMESPTEPHKEKPREPHTESPTETYTDNSREPHTESPREPHKENPMETHTESPRESHTESPREPHKENPREPHTASPREPHTESPTEPHTEKPREPHTQSPMKLHTEKPTEPPTENLMETHVGMAMQNSTEPHTESLMEHPRGSRTVNLSEPSMENPTEVPGVEFPRPVDTAGRPPSAGQLSQNSAHAPPTSVPLGVPGVSLLAGAPSGREPPGAADWQGAPPSMGEPHLERPTWGGPLVPQSSPELELEVLEGFWEEPASGQELANLSTVEAPGPCAHSPCLHGGSCLARGPTYSCHCARGFAGENCEIDVDDCTSGPCENGGTCVDEVASFTCLCLPSYGGALCEKDTEGCERGWVKFQGNCYRHFARRRAWEDAERDCRRRAGHLSSVHSDEEQAFISGFAHENTWIGLNDRIVERDFQWTDNSALQFENWWQSQPDNFFAGGEDCVVMVAHEHGRWNDVPCNYNLPYVCKKGTVLCGPPPAVENASPAGTPKAKYAVGASVRYRCRPGFLQHRPAPVHCRRDGRWDRPQLVCSRPRRAHRTRRHRRHHPHRRAHRHPRRGERRQHPGEDWGREDAALC